MQQEIERFLNLRHLPASCSATEAAGYLGISPHEIPILLAKGYLKPIGHPAPNAPKFFMTSRLEELGRDEKWFGKARDAISEHWQLKNKRKAKESAASAKPQVKEEAAANAG
jgi:hypothetical protein